MLKNKMLRYRVMEFHRELTRRGQYAEAKRVFLLLRDGSLILEAGDVDCYLERVFTEMGCRKVIAGGEPYTVKVYLETGLAVLPWK